MVSLFFIGFRHRPGTGRLCGGPLWRTPDSVCRPRQLCGGRPDCQHGPRLQHAAGSLLFCGPGQCAPFHPVDFTILNKRVSQQRIGHAFSVHGLSGNLGWALAPLFMAGITTATGSWRLACLGGALCAAVVLAIMVFNRDALDDRAESAGAAAKPAAGAIAAPQEHPHGLHEAAIGVAVLFLLLLEHLRAQCHSELCQPGPAIHVRPAAFRDGADRHRLYAVRRCRHGRGRLRLPRSGWRR